MKKLFLIIMMVLVVSFGSLVFTVRSSSALGTGIMVTDPFEELQTLNTYLKEASSYMLQGEQYVTQAAELRSLVATNPAAVMGTLSTSINPELGQMASQIQQLAQNGSQLASTMSAIKGMGASSASLNNISGSISSQIASILQNYGVQANDQALTGQNLTNLLNQLSTSAGPTEALQIDGAINGQEMQQLQQINSNLTQAQSLAIQQQQHTAAASSEVDQEGDFSNANIGAQAPSSSGDLW